MRLLLALSILLPQSSPAETDALHRLIKPRPDEWKWAQVPWMGDLAEARKKAAAEDKPLYVWTMAGEPLGQC